jgi:hypothetical protein
MFERNPILDPERFWGGTLAAKRARRAAERIRRRPRRVLGVRPADEARGIRDELGDAAVLRAAADDLDRLWRLDEVSGARDSIGGVEYGRLSRAPRLRSVADKIDRPVTS